jgi:hypothetical protein
VTELEQLRLALAESESKRLAEKKLHAQMTEELQLRIDALRTEAANVASALALEGWTPWKYETKKTGYVARWSARVLAERAADVAAEVERKDGFVAEVKRAQRG